MLMKSTARIFDPNSRPIVDGAEGGAPSESNRSQPATVIPFALLLVFFAARGARNTLAAIKAIFAFPGSEIGRVGLVGAPAVA